MTPNVNTLSGSSLTSVCIGVQVSLDSICYHGDMHSDERHDGLQNFKDGKVRTCYGTTSSIRSIYMLAETTGCL